MGPNIKKNPLYISVYLLIFSYVVGEFFIPKYNILYIFNLFGILGLISSTVLFISAFNLFKSYEENPLPYSETNKIIKTGIFAYTRNPIYLSFVLFHLSMFFVFENIMYFLTSISIFIWLNNYIIPEEEKYLKNKFGDEYSRYCLAVNSWIFF